jgi:glycosyltransferase involved in cell wall biosynthesis
MIKLALLATDVREHAKDYQNPAPGFGTAPDALIQGLAAVPGLEVHVVSCTQQRMRSPEKLAANTWFHSLHVSKTGWLRTGYQGCIRTIRKKLKEIHPDIVHGQGTERDCALGAVLSGYPNVITIHGNMRLIARLNHARPFSYEWLAARLEAFAIPRSRGVVCITNYTRDAVADLAKQTWIVPNAVDAGLFDLQPEKNPERPRVILCVGAVCLRKNQIAFIRALDPLAASGTFRLEFLGAALQKESYCREFLDLLRTRPWCGHAGFVNREKLKSHLRTATLLALPSLEDNCPMVVLEAMAAGVPVMAAKVGGVPDLIEEGKTGLFCDPLNPASMRDTTARLLDDPALGCQLAAAAKLKAHKRFQPAVIAQRHLEIYREVLNTRS